MNGNTTHLADRVEGHHPHLNLGDLYDAALPKDAPGSWIRGAIEAMQATCEVQS